VKILSVIFEKPYRSEKDPDVLWQFVIETDEVCHSKYCKGFGGVLRKHAEGWQAKNHSAEQYSAPAKTREGAIQNCIPTALELFAKYDEEQRQEDQERDERYKRRTELAKLFSPEYTGFDILVGVNAGESAPIKFMLKIENLSERQVREIARLLHSL
jgi:hypothetical protein